MMQLIVTAALVILVLYAIVLLVPGMAFFTSKKIKPAARPRTLISVLVPVRNEEEDLAACLESLARQDYPADQFEIIVIDDHSADRTKSIAEQFAQKFPRLTVLSNAPGEAGKKKALTAGVRYAMGTLIATTDGDCVVPPRWLACIAALYEREKPTFIAGPVAYKKGNFFRDLLAAEQAALQLVAGGAMRCGVPLLSSGANMAYRKDFFFSAGGYERDVHASGDDMLLMLKAGRTQGKLAYLASPEAVVRTNAARSWGEAVAQRRRWVSKFSAYRSAAIAATGVVVFLANALAPALVIAVLAKAQPWQAFAGLLAGKVGVDLLLLSLAVPFFREPRILLPALAGQFVYPVLALVSTVAGFSGAYRWKGRSWKT